MKKAVMFIAVSCLLLAADQTSFAQTRVANDPTRIGVGARPLGMGKAFAGLSDDPSALLLNPAGLAQIKERQFISMSGKFVGEMDYSLLGAAFPFLSGTAGIGYVGSGIGFTAPSPEAVTVGGEIRYIPSTTEGASYSYGNAAFLLSYGQEVNFLERNISLGATLKLISQNLTGPGITGGTASGLDLNLALLFKPRPEISVGLNQINILPASLGGKVSWADGTDESLPTKTKLGLAVKLLGEDGLRMVGEQEAKFLLDGDFYPTRPDLPNLLHAGLEWSPVEYLDLRLGVDQDTVGRAGGGLDVANNLTYGVGILFSGFRFDYAYHGYFDIPDNTTHYFSLSYGIWKRKEPAAYLSMISPADESIVYEQSVKVLGQVLDKRVVRVKVAGQDIVTRPGETFEAEVPLAAIKNPIPVVAFGRDNRLLEKKTLRSLKLKTFKDLAADYWARLPVEQLATLNIISGYPDGAFKPDGNITRAELTTLLVKLAGKEIREAETAPFKDVAKYHWAAKYIRAGVKQALIFGYLDKTFRPGRPITRAEGVAVIARFADLPKPKVLEPVFKDVPGRYWAFATISSAWEAGLLKYLEGKPFEPKRPLTRGETAEILSRTKYAADRISELMDFKTGY